MVTLGMNSVWCDGAHPGGSERRMSFPLASVLQGVVPSAPAWARTGNPAAAMAAGFVEVWSTIKLLIVRGCVS